MTLFFQIYPLRPITNLATQEALAIITTLYAQHSLNGLILSARSTNCIHSYRHVAFALFNSCGLPLRTDPPFIYTAVGFYHVLIFRLQGSMRSYRTPSNIMRSPSSYIAYNNPTLHPKIKETNKLLHRYSCLKIPNSSSNVNKKPFQIKLKPILYSDSFCENNFVALMPTAIPRSTPPSSSDHILFPYI